jgi:two-component system cell cycle sensor histidine kinase/response regulator CckA
LNGTNQKRVLVLEDEPVIGRILERVLRADGFEVDLTANGLIAKEKIDAGAAYDVLIFDIRTPLISGIQLYEYLQKMHPVFTERVIFTTGDYLNTHTRTFLEKVKRSYLAKPYTPTQVKSLVNQVLEGHLSAVQGSSG